MGLAASVWGVELHLGPFPCRDGGLSRAGCCVLRVPGSRLPNLIFWGRRSIRFRLLQEDFVELVRDKPSCFIHSDRAAHLSSTNTAPSSRNVHLHSVFTVPTSYLLSAPALFCPGLLLPTVPTPSRPSPTSPSPSCLASLCPSPRTNPQ